MEKAVRIALYILYVMEYFSFHYIIFRKPYICRKNRWLYIVGMLVLVNIALWICPEDSVIEYLLMYGAIFLGLKMLFGETAGQLGKEFLLAFLTISILQSELERMIVFATEWGLTYVEMVAIIGVCVFLWVFYLFYGRKHPLNLAISNKVWWLVDFIFFIIVFMYEFYSFILKHLDITEVVYGVLTVFTSMSGILSCLLIYSLLIYDNHIRQARTQNALLESFQEQQRQYFQGVMEKEYETKRFRHDILNELLQLKKYSEENENEKLAAYLDEMLGKIGSLSNQYNVGDDVVNTILNHYFTPISENCDITVKGYVQEEIQMSQRDWCLLISNIVKNAVEAAVQVTETKPMIVFELRQGKDFLEITCSNTYEGTIRPDKNQLLLTTKEDKEHHGFGMETIREIVLGHGGTYRISTENQVFTMQIFLKLDRSTGNKTA